MKITVKFIMLVMIMLLTGCVPENLNYTWMEHPIDPVRMPSQNSFIEGKEVRIIKGKSDDAKILLLKGSDIHHLYGSYQTFTNGIADQLSKELHYMNINISDTAEKSLEIAVNNAKYEKGFLGGAETLEFTVKFGNGKTKFYSVRNSSGGPPERMLDGAVALSVLEIANDPVVQAYINE
jgi:hypothetical protein